MKIQVNFDNTNTVNIPMLRTRKRGTIRLTRFVSAGAA